MKLKVYNKEKKAPQSNQPIQPGACSVILNKKKQIFLHKRADSELWALPGGVMESGESISSCCLREAKEETDLKIKIKKLIGVYTSPDCVFEWSDKKKSKVWQIFVVAFLSFVENDKFILNKESSEAGWFFEEEIGKMKTFPFVKEAIRDGLYKNKAYFD